MAVPEPEAHRNRLLAAARRTVEAARAANADPHDMAAELHRTWAGLAGPPTVFDHEFQSDPVTGVEALAFVVDEGAAGVVLRLTGELPDSFEPVVVGASPAEARLAFFAPDPAD
jgi:hypothetical protein